MKIHRYFDMIKYNLEYLCSHKQMFGTTITEYYSYLIMFPCLSLQTSKMSSRNLNYIRLSYNMSHICQLINWNNVDRLPCFSPSLLHQLEVAQYFPYVLLEIQSDKIISLLIRITIYRLSNWGEFTISSNITGPILR